MFMMVVNLTVYMPREGQESLGILSLRYRKAWLHLGFAGEIPPFSMITSCPNLNAGKNLLQQLLNPQSGILCHSPGCS